MLSAPIGPELANAADIMIKDYMAVNAKDTVLITADTSSDMAVVEAILNCADTTGAKTVVMVIPPLPFQSTLADPYISEPLAAAMKECAHVNANQMRTRSCHPPMTNHAASSALPSMPC